MFSSVSFLDGPYAYLGIGIAFLSAGLVWTYTGEVWTNFGRVVYRAEQPKEFWVAVIAFYLIGALFTASFVFQIYSP
jgi:hypothetical protein